MKKTRRLLHDVLIKSLNTEQMNHLGRDVDSSFSVYEYSGFGDKIVVPRKVAADCIVEYFRSEKAILDFIAYMLAREGHGMSGGVIRLKSKERLLDELKDQGWFYDQDKAAFVQEQSTRQSTDWGFMQVDQEYNLCFVSIDIVASSELVRTNVKDDLNTTVGRLKAYVQRHVETWDGRLWFWYGDGGLAAFHGKDSPPMSVLSMISILSYLPVFNIAENALRPENDVKLRIGMHYGSAVYKQDVNQIASQDMRVAQDIEKLGADPNSIAISDALFRMLPDEVRKSFHENIPVNGLHTHKYYPV